MLIASYKRLLINIVLSGKKGANCWPLNCTTVLHCPSSKKHDTSKELYHININMLQDHDYYQTVSLYNNLSFYTRDIIAYIAGFAG